MKKQEIWKLKVGDLVSDCLSWCSHIKTIGTVIKKEIYDGCNGFIIAHNKRTNKTITKDIKNGKKECVLTVKFETGQIRYYDTSNDEFRFKNFIKEE